jgi:hypothetical protein
VRLIVALAGRSPLGRAILLRNGVLTTMAEAVSSTLSNFTHLPSRAFFSPSVHPITIRRPLNWCPEHHVKCVCVPLPSVGALPGRPLDVAVLGVALLCGKPDECVGMVNKRLPAGVSHHMLSAR